MPRTRALVLGLLLAAELTRAAADCGQCLDLSARRDLDYTSPSGVRVLVAGRNHCSEAVDGYSCRFRVRALGAGGTEIAAQAGSFGDTIEPRAAVETMVFVVCDSERVRSIAVERLP